MAIKIFNFEEWKEHSYAELLKVIYKDLSFEDLNILLLREISNSKSITKKQIIKLLDKRGNLSFLSIKIPSHKKRSYFVDISVRSTWTALEQLAKDSLRKKPRKNIVDKLLVVLAISETLKAHKSKRIRNIIGIKN